MKTIFDLLSICTGDTLITSFGYDANIESIVLRKMDSLQRLSKVNNVRTFIPDGPRCDILCYEVSVEFMKFPSTKNIQSKEEICSVCINYDIRLWAIIGYL